MHHLVETQRLLKKVRTEKDISLKDLSKKLKVPLSVLIELETDESFLDKRYPYSVFLLKSVCKELDIQIPDPPQQENTQTKSLEKEKSNNKTSKLLAVSLKTKVLSIFKISFLFVLISTFFVLSISLKSNINYDEIFSSKKVKTYTFDNVDTEDFKSKSILLLASNNIWITATIDGEKKVFNLKKGDNIKLEFTNKIHFETIGNAKSLVIEYDGEKVNLPDKVIIHNIFVDKEGIFANGYNLLKGRSG